MMEWRTEENVDEVTEFLLANWNDDFHKIDIPCKDVILKCLPFQVSTGFGREWRKGC